MVNDCILLLFEINRKKNVRMSHLGKGFCQMTHLSYFKGGPLLTVYSHLNVDLKAEILLRVAMNATMVKWILDSLHFR